MAEVLYSLREIQPHGKEATMPLSDASTSEVAILSRVLEPDKPTLSPEAARALLALDFSRADKERMRELSAKAREGTLTPAEQAATDNYERVGHMLNILQSKARRSLRGRDGPSEKHLGNADALPPGLTPKAFHNSAQGRAAHPGERGCPPPYAEGVS
jgi:hypothetical protein